MGKYLWLAVTADEYELPLYVADTARQLGEFLGCTKSAVVSSAIIGYSGRWKKRKIIRVDLNEELK